MYLYHNDNTVFFIMVRLTITPCKQEDDEGIDVSSSSHHENEKNKCDELSEGPYHYKLFSIMIHSGSASGGHYYAYIKDFTNGKWFCFNDTSVSRVNSRNTTFRNNFVVDSVFKFVVD